MHQARDLDHAGDAGGVVHRSVINAVAVHGPSHALMVQVRGHDDVLVLELFGRCPARRLTTLDAHLAAVDHGFRLEHSLKRKGGQRLVVVRQLFNFREGVAGSLE